MKKLISILIIIIYFSLSSIKVIDLHFCQDRLESVDVFQKATPCCTGHDLENSSCCSDKPVTIHLVDTQLSGQKLIIHPPVGWQPLLCNTQESLAENTDTGQSIFFFRVNESPPKERFKLYHSFIFYG